jgi:hypothetical protein
MKWAPSFRGGAEASNAESHFMIPMGRARVEPDRSKRRCCCEFQSSHPSSEGLMKTAIACLVVTLALFGTSSANAKGCIKGAIVGGVAGHYAAHHGMLGAAAGCLYGRHHAKEQERQQQQQQNQANGQGKI